MDRIWDEVFAGPRPPPLTVPSPSAPPGGACAPSAQPPPFSANTSARPIPTISPSFSPSFSQNFSPSFGASFQHSFRGSSAGVGKGAPEAAGGVGSSSQGVGSSLSLGPMNGPADGGANAPRKLRSGLSIELPGSRGALDCTDALLAASPSPSPLPSSTINFQIPNPPPAPLPQPMQDSRSKPLCCATFHLPPWFGCLAIALWCSILNLSKLDLYTQGLTHMTPKCQIPKRPCVFPVFLFVGRWRPASQHRFPREPQRGRGVRGGAAGDSHRQCCGTPLVTRLCAVSPHRIWLHPRHPLTSYATHRRIPLKPCESL